jgi:hypothetical protein
MNQYVKNKRRRRKQTSSKSYFYSIGYAVLGFRVLRERHKIKMQG